MYWQKRFDRENPNEAIEKRIREIFEMNEGKIGYRRIDLTLRDEGIIVNHKKIKRIMRKLEFKENLRITRSFNLWKN